MPIEGVRMSEISEEQKRLLEMLDRRNPSEIAIRHIYEFLEEKPEEEALDPKWKDIWENYKRYARRMVPPSIIKEIEGILQSIKCWGICSFRYSYC